MLYLGLLSLYHRNISTNCGPDMLMMITSFYVMLSPCGAAYSLDARRAARRRGTLADVLIIPWAQRLLQIQLCMIYFFTARLKCNGSTWLGGTAIHYILFNHEVGQFNLEWLADIPCSISVMTLTALLVEFALAFLLWFRPTRRWVALVGVLLHAGIFPLVNVPLFGEQMTALYLVFLAPDELDGCDPRSSGLVQAERSDGLLIGPRRDSPSGLPGWRQLELAFEAVEENRDHWRKQWLTRGTSPRDFGREAVPTGQPSRAHARSWRLRPFESTPSRAWSRLSTQDRA